MAVALRMLNNKRYWDREKADDEEWLGEGEIRADALRNVETKDNALSIYVVDESASAVDRTLAAFAANRDCLDKVDFALFETGLLDALETEVTATAGGTPDSEVNVQHHDVIHLTGSKLLRLVEMLIDQCQIERRTRPRVEKLIANGIANGQIDIKHLRDSMVESLKKRNLI